MAKSFNSQIKAYEHGNVEAMRKDPTFPIYQLGYTSGLQKTRLLVLSHLEDKYINAPDRPDRGTEEAKYLLGLASELADLLRTVEL